MLFRNMVARNPLEHHRAATPLELLFDLVYVAAISAAAAGLHHGLLEHHVFAAGWRFLFAMFLLWNAWVSFSWFASGYDNDDVFYRVSVLVQMVGSVMIAVNIYNVFEMKPLTVGLIGYILMRLALVSQFCRAYRDDPTQRGVMRRSIVGTTAVQCGWVVWIFLPESWQFVAMLLMIAAELLVVIWQHGGEYYSWHPHHLAERYSLLTIIVLGEGIIGAVNITQALVNGGDGWVLRVLNLGSALLSLMFVLWWLYFNVPFAQALSAKRGRLNVMAFSYGHYCVFTVLAAIGGGLELLADVVVAHGGHGAEGLSDVYVMVVLAVMVGVYLAVMTLMNGLSIRDGQRHWVLLVAWLVLALACVLVAWGLPISLGIWVAIVAPVLMIVALRPAQLGYLARCGH